MNIVDSAVVISSIYYKCVEEHFLEIILLPYKTDCAYLSTDSI